MRPGRAKKPFGQKRVRFDRHLWDRWLERLNGPDPDDPRYQYLASGIASFRKTLAKREPLEGSYQV